MLTSFLLKFMNFNTFLLLFLVGVRCDIPPKVKNAVITTKPEELYVDGSNVTYKCQSSFLIIGNSTVFCCNGTWEETPTCEGEVLVGLSFKINCHLKLGTDYKTPR